MHDKSESSRIWVKQSQIMNVCPNHVSLITIRNSENQIWDGCGVISFNFYPAFYIDVRGTVAKKSKVIQKLEKSSHTKLRIVVTKPAIKRSELREFRGS